MVRPSLLGSAGATIAITGALIAACSPGGSSGAPKQRPAPLVMVAKVEARDVPVEIQAPVELRPLVQADVGSKVLGYIDAVLVERGDRVKKGQTLALIRPSDLPDQLTAARGTVAQADAARRLAKVSAERAEQLRPEGLLAQSEVDRARASLASASAVESAARAQLAALGVRLGETKLESPLDGVVLYRRLDPGALVGPPSGGAIVTVANTDILRVFISVNERDAKGVVVGLDAHVEVDALAGKRYSGKVVRLAPAFDSLTRTLEAEVQLQNDTGELRPGMYGRAGIRLDLHPQAPVIAAVAMQISNKKRYVFVVAGGKAQRREIETGVDAGDWLEVTRGLQPGEDVVIAGADGLADGTAVRVAHGGPGASASAAAPKPPAAAAASGSSAAPSTD
jgi:membrane fusion protein (multidrug efflux system)